MGPASPLFFVLLGVAGFFVLLVLVVSMLNRFLVKAEPGSALVKTGFGTSQPKVFLSSAFVLPLLHRIDTIDLTVKTVRIQRRKGESLSCADGIRAEVEVDFYIKINPVEEDIRHVASTIGCGRASDTEILRELFEAKFADALKTAGATLQFDQLYQNRRAFRDEVLKALGQEGDQEVVLNGYKLDDVAIQYLEQLPLEMHNEDNVLDSRGRKEIAQRTSEEVEAANARLRQKEVTIAEQNREARLRQLVIQQDIAEKEAAQEREIREAQATEQAKAQQTIEEQNRLSEEARIQKERLVRLAEEAREKDVTEAEIARRRAVELAEEARREEIEAAQVKRERTVKVAEQDQIRDVEIARIRREGAEAEALREKLKMLEETALQEAEKIRAEEQAQTVRALEVANRQKQIETIEAQQEAAVAREARQVKADVEAYEMRTVAQARLEAAQLDADAAEKRALATRVVGEAEAETLRLHLEAENVIGQQAILAQALQQLLPQLPQLVEHLMRPAEKIDSIKVLNVQGLGGSPLAGGDGAAGGQNLAGSLMGTVVQMGALMPVLRELMKALNTQDEGGDLLRQLRSLPGGATLLSALQQQPDETEILEDLSVSPTPRGDGDPKKK